jgi:integrase
LHRYSAEIRQRGHATFLQLISKTQWITATVIALRIDGTKKEGNAFRQRRLKTLFGFAGIEGGHAHRFRDTFACELLLTGLPIERVSILLGHNSIKITEKHYNPWVRSRQDQLEADLERAWSQDLVALMEAARDFGGPLKGTKKVHEKCERIN